MPHTGKSKPTETSCLSLGPDLHEGMQQPSAPVVKTRLRGNTAPSQKLPSAQKHAKGRSLPPAPTTATRKVPEKCQQGPAINATPLTHPDLLSNSTEPEMSSGSNANGMLVSSDDDASSYEPSSREQASPDIAERGLPVARPPLHPKTFSKHGHNVPQRQTSTARASDDPAKPGSHRKSIVEPIPQVLEQAVHFLHCHSCHHPRCRLVLYWVYLNMEHCAASMTCVCHAVHLCPSSTSHMWLIPECGTEQ